MRGKNDFRELRQRWIFTFQLEIFQAWNPQINLFSKLLSSVAQNTLFITHIYTDSANCILQVFPKPKVANKKLNYISDQQVILLQVFLALNMECKGPEILQRFPIENSYLACIKSW